MYSELLKKGRPQIRSLTLITYKLLARTSEDNPVFHPRTLTFSTKDNDSRNHVCNSNSITSTGILLQTSTYELWLTTIQSFPSIVHEQIDHASMEILLQLWHRRASQNPLERKMGLRVLQTKCNCITCMQWVFSENRRPAANQLHSLTHNIAAEP